MGGGGGGGGGESNDSSHIANRKATSDISGLPSGMNIIMKSRVGIICFRERENERSHMSF